MEEDIDRFLFRREPGVGEDGGESERDISK
jgi:hypothetical protein